MTTTIVPPLPGSVLRHQILKRMGMRQAELARAMGLSPVRISQIMTGHAPITVETALRLGQVTGTDPEYWIRVQTDFELFHAKKRLASILQKLPQLPGALSAS